MNTPVMKAITVTKLKYRYTYNFCKNMRCMMNDLNITALPIKIRTNKCRSQRASEHIPTFFAKPYSK